MLTKPMTQITPVSLTVKDVEQNLLRPPKHGSRQETRVIEFVELEGAADAILIGFPDLVVWGFALQGDEMTMSMLILLLWAFRSLLSEEARRVRPSMPWRT